MANAILPSVVLLIVAPSLPDEVVDLRKCAAARGRFPYCQCNHLSIRVRRLVVLLPSIYSRKRLGIRDRDLFTMTAGLISLGPLRGLPGRREFEGR